MITILADHNIEGQALLLWGTLGAAARAVQIEAELLAALERQAHLRGVGLETLVNLWLQQKLREEVQSTTT